MKALTLAREALRILNLDKGDEYRYNVAIPLKEAIKELEALQNRSCDGCKHKIKIFVCRNCSGFYKNKFEPKEEK